MSNDQGPLEEIRRRQKARNRVVALLLAGAVLLFYFISLVRIGGAAAG
jgi:hypothetical protein